MIKKNQHIVILITIVLALIGCQTQTNKKLCEADSLLETNLDSAKKIVLSIQPNSLHNVADSAYYVLLKSVITYKSYEKQPTSVLNFPVQFYEKKKDYRLLQKAYYYRGAINYDNKGKIEISLLDYKKAENLNKEVEDSILISSLYKSFAVLYFSSKKYREQIAYENKSALLAKKNNNLDLLACNYAGLAIAYSALNRRQTATLYMDSMLNIVNYIIDNDSKSIVYSNLGNFYVDENTDKAYKLYKKALYYNSNNKMAYFGLLKIAVRKGNEISTLKLWKELKNTNDDELKQEIYTLFRDEAKKRGDIETAYLYSNKLDSLNFKVKSQAITYRVDSLQHSFQYDIDKNKIVKQKTYLFYICLVSGCILITIFSIIYFRRKLILKKQMRVLDKIITESNIIKYTLEEKEKILNRLNAKLTQKEKEFKIKSKEYNKYLKGIEQGLQVMQFVCYEKDYVISESQDRKNFILCYKLIDGDFMSKIEPYTTLQEQIFCSLIRLNFSKEQIMFALPLSNDSFRKLKSRLLNKLNSKNDLKHFCDILRAF